MQEVGGAWRCASVPLRVCVTWQVGKPLFPGKDEPDQLDRIFSIMGTPSPATWPDGPKLPRCGTRHARAPPPHTRTSPSAQRQR